MLSPNAANNREKYELQKPQSVQLQEEMKCQVCCPSCSSPQQLLGDTAALPHSQLSLMTVKMSDGLKRKACLNDKLPQLPSYLPEQVTCAVIARLGRRGESKTEPNTSEITVNGQYYSLSPPPCLSLYLSTRTQVPVKQQGPFFIPLTGPSFLCLSLSLPTDRQKKRGSGKREAFVGDSVYVLEMETHIKKKYSLSLWPNVIKGLQFKYKLSHMNKSYEQYNVDGF